MRSWTITSHETKLGPVAHESVGTPVWRRVLLVVVPALVLLTSKSSVAQPIYFATWDELGTATSVLWDCPATRDEFVDARCRRERPGLRRALRERIFAARAPVNVGRFDFGRRRFPLTVLGVLAPEVSNERDSWDELGLEPMPPRFLDSIPDPAPEERGVHDGRRVITPSAPDPHVSSEAALLARWTVARSFVQFPDEASGEAWFRNAAPNIVGVLIFRVRGTWRVELPPTWLQRQLDAQLRRLARLARAPRPAGTRNVMTGVLIEPLAWVIIDPSRAGRARILRSGVVARSSADRGRMQALQVRWQSGGSTEGRTPRDAPSDTQARPGAAGSTTLPAPNEHAVIRIFRDQLRTWLGAEHAAAIESVSGEDTATASTARLRYLLADRAIRRFAASAAEQAGAGHVARRLRALPEVATAEGARDATEVATDSLTPFDDSHDAGPDAQAIEAAARAIVAARDALTLVATDGDAEELVRATLAAARAGARCEPPQRCPPPIAQSVIAVLRGLIVAAREDIARGGAAQ